MSDPFVAEIRIFGFNFPPQGWAFCDGQLMSIQQNTALFSLLGTNYGGNGTSTFGLPNLQGNLPLHTGSGPGPGLSFYSVGETGGVPSVTVLNSQMASHSHFINADTANAGSDSPSGAIFKAGFHPGNPGTAVWPYNAGPANTALDSRSLSAAGGTLPHNNMMPSLVLNFCIALTGIYPARG
jgi:microcystin-dependent protein